MLDKSLTTFNTISLNKLEASGLFQKRLDRKYVIPRSMIGELLEYCSDFYDILTIDDSRIFDYQTTYFDTPDFNFYHQHQSGRATRKKLRERTYLNSGEKYLEIKCRTNKGTTVKHRIVVDGAIDLSEFIEKHSGFSKNILSNTLVTRYKRITLFHKTRVEKVTLDLDLTYLRGDRIVSYPNIVMVEIKVPNLHEGQLFHFMKNHGIRKGSLSKYCLGMISLDNGIKHNRFKRIYTRLVNLNNYGFSGLLHQ
ncbi:MAG: VTC domain-containing protein [Chitinophagaceae bacterium]|nr:VTC domain-containing protein [Chitinophagaceae bacterium]